MRPALACRRLVDKLRLHRSDERETQRTTPTQRNSRRQPLPWFRNILAKLNVYLVMKNDPECRAALRMIRATIEEHCPPGVLMSEEQVNGHYGPSVLDEAEALSVAIVATVERLSFEPREIPPAPSIKT
ncbi:hypothetical protein [Mesorhizobium sp. M2E.F.Ca.ET.154.01.1.1]|uniref:hypothetical protein n=2 Tax=Mesorhizobium TaxID=68287 RepID=UPI001FED618B|nr:hypothetical protein [Mesorhizobium sp. M2E.F.Ca.ET.154.01.1.1]